MANFKNVLKKKGKRAALRTRLEKEKKSSYADDRKWQYELDQAGNAYAVIRFLPTSGPDIDWIRKNKPEIPEGEESFWVSRWDHGFKHQGKWFGAVCPTTWGDDCPVCAYNSNEINSTGLEFKDLPDEHPVKKAVRNRKRNEKHFANILVVKDPANPENEGKVFIFEYGFTIQQYIEAKLIPQYEDEVEQDVSDMLEGMNFKLKVYKHKKQVKYDRSEWEAPSAISDDENVLEGIWEKEYALHEFIDDSVKEDYDTMAGKFNRVMNVAAGATDNQNSVPVDDKDQVTTSPQKVNSAATTSSSANDDDDDEDEKFLKMLQS